MIEVKTKLKRWGNSFGVVLPIRVIEQEKMNEGEDIRILVKKEKKVNVLKETFGTIKFKKNTEEMMRETDRDLYNE